jgi:hypothetical protein
MISLRVDASLGPLDATDASGCVVALGVDPNYE